MWGNIGRGLPWNFRAGHEPSRTLSPLNSIRRRGLRLPHREILPCGHLLSIDLSRYRSVKENIAISYVEPWPFPKAGSHGPPCPCRGHTVSGVCCAIPQGTGDGSCSGSLPHSVCWQRGVLGDLLRPSVLKGTREIGFKHSFLSSLNLPALTTLPVSWAAPCFLLVRLSLFC